MNKDRAKHIEVLKEYKEEIDHEVVVAEANYGDFNIDEDMIVKGHELQEALDHAINCVGAIEQIKWERDIAISQLNELGLDLGQKTDEVQRAIQHFNNLKKIAKGSDKE